MHCIADGGRRCSAVVSAPLGGQKVVGSNPAPPTENPDTTTTPPQRPTETTSSVIAAISVEITVFVSVPGPTGLLVEIPINLVKQKVTPHGWCLI